MGTSVTAERVTRHLDRFEDVSCVMAKADLNKVEEWKASVGKAIARCFQLAGVTQKEAAGLLDRDQAQVARWIASTERPQFDVIFAVDRLREPLVIALAELVGAGVETVITVRRRIA